MSYPARAEALDKYDNLLNQIFREVIKKIIKRTFYKFGMWIFWSNSYEDMLEQNWTVSCLNSVQTYLDSKKIGQM